MEAPSDNLSSSTDNTSTMKSTEMLNPEEEHMEGAGDTNEAETKRVPEEEEGSVVSDENEMKNSSQPEKENSPSKPVESVSFKLVYMKKNYDICFDIDEKISELKLKIQTLTEVPPAMQKLMCKGLVKDDQTLREAKVTKGAKMMLIGSTLKDVLTVNKTPTASASENASKVDTVTATKEPLSQQKPHKKILDKGKPDDVMIGLKNKKEPLPTVPISGMYNKAGGKVRLTFKLELDQLWIGTKERTEKLKMDSIKKVISEPLEGHEEYHMMALQLGPTEASRYWIYWVPAQYIDSIKDAVLGKWQSFF